MLVTGGTGGIGLATAAGLAGLGARVGIVGRDRPGPRRRPSGRARHRRRRSTCSPPTCPPSARCAGSPARCSRRTRASTSWSTTSAATGRHRHLTVDGLEHTFAVNHLAPFLLTNLLLDRLRASAPARVVTVSSGAQAMGRIDFDDLQGERGYSGQRAYNQSKLANVLFTYELARRLRGLRGHRQRAAPRRGPHRLRPGGLRAGWMRLLLPVVRPFLKSPEKGAETSIYLASSPEVDGVTGRYFANCRSKTSARASYDTGAAAQLWQVSAALVGLTTADAS